MLMETVSVLEIKFDIENVTNTIYPVILNHEQELILIDCGYPNFLPLIEIEAEKKGISIEKLTKIVITHHDFDHMGALAEFKSKYPKIEILSSVDEELKGLFAIMVGYIMETLGRHYKK